jgi:hypothetical protein
VFFYVTGKTRPVDGWVWDLYMYRGSVGNRDTEQGHRQQHETKHGLAVAPATKEKIGVAKAPTHTADAVIAEDQLWMDSTSTALLRWQLNTGSLSCISAMRCAVPYVPSVAASRLCVFCHFLLLSANPGAGKQ